VNAADSVACQCRPLKGQSLEERPHQEKEQALKNKSNSENPGSGINNGEMD
jgi:hypothetical protein